MHLRGHRSQAGCKDYTLKKYDEDRFVALTLNRLSHRTSNMSEMAASVNHLEVMEVALKELSLRD